MEFIYELLLAYAICSGLLTTLGMALIAKHHFFPKPPKLDSPIMLIPLGPNGEGIRSERYR
jgi:hypothetical protein